MINYVLLRWRILTPHAINRRIFLIMRFTALWVLLGTMHLSGETLSQTITLDRKHTHLKQIFSVIENQTGYTVLYSDEILLESEPISVNARKMPLEAFLSKVLKPASLTYRIDGMSIFVKPDTKHRLPSKYRGNSIRLLQPQQTISGTVVDEIGQPLAGVTVSVKGMSAVTTTDDGGMYRIEVPAGGTVLLFTNVGFESVERSISNQDRIDVSMKATVSDLDEVVVVGYGTQKKVNLTGAVSMVEFDDELNNRPITNASQALGGTASGIWVSQNSGKPGGDGAQLRIRGWGTLNNSNPLVIVDGIEGSFDQLNPNDIESISVLKDAASAAIYGSKAANGVVLVTTKSGKSSEKMTVNLNSYFGLQSLGRRYDVINNSAESMELTNVALTNEGSAPLFSEELIEAFRNGNDRYKYPSTDWFNELFKTAAMHEHNVSIMGGTAQTSSFFSFNYLNQQGIVPNTASERYGMRLNVDSRVSNWLTVGGRINYLRRQSKEPYADATYGSMGRVFEMLSGAAPYMAPYTRDGRYGSVQAIGSDGSLLYDNRNPLIDAANGLNKIGNNILTLNVNLDIKLSDILSFRTTFASNRDWDLTDKYNTSVFGYTDTGIETITKNFNREGLEIDRTHVGSTNNNLFSTLNLTKDFSSDHELSAIAGIQLEDSKIENLYARRTSPPKEGLTQVDAGTTGIRGEGNMTSLRMFSYFGRVNYAFLSRYLFEANFRADASSRFKAGNRWGLFPGFSLGWRLSDEAFIRDLDVFSNLKLRASWGQLGNQNIAGYWPFLTVIAQSNELSYNYGGVFSPGAAVTALVDENITWETTSTLDFGLDVGVFDNRLNIEVDYFKRRTKDIIVQLPIPLILGGLTAPHENVGEMLNNGIEFIVNYDNRKTDRDQFGFNVGLNLTHIDNEVTRFNEGDSPDQLYLIREGYAYNTLYGYRAIGVYQSDNEAKQHMHANSFTPKAGNLKFEDLNNDGRLTFEDKMGLGNTIPTYTFGLSAGFRYKGFDLNFLFQGVADVSLYTQNNFTDMDWENRMISTRWRNAWSPDNPDTDVPSLKFNNAWDASESSYWVQDLSYIKLKNVQLGYAIPTSALTRIGIEKLYVYANAQNVFTLVSNDEYEGYDPERNTFNNGQNMYPIPRIVSFGVNVSF